MTLFKNDCLYGGKATPETGGGGTVNNQDITITENGVYTAGEGYTGIGTATVNVPSGGDIITAKNATGSAISEGDKVWIYRTAGEGLKLVNFSEPNYILANSKIYGINVSYDSSTGIISNFVAGTNNYLGLINTFNPSSNTWEQVYRVKTPSSYDTYNRVLQLASDTSNSYYRAGMSIEISSEGVFGFGVTNVITSWAIGWAWGSTSIPTNTWCWVKLEFTGTQYILSISDDGNSWNQEAVITSSTAISANGTIGIGGSQNTSPHWGGQVDLSKSYMKIGSNYWWTGAYRVTEAEKYVTGFATENIASGAEGDAKTVMPETLSVSITADANDATITVE